MAKVEKRQKQEEDAAEKMKQAEIEYKAKIDVANQKQNKIKDETSNTARELQVDSPVKGRALYAKYAEHHKHAFQALYKFIFLGIVDSYR